MRFYLKPSVQNWTFSFFASILRVETNLTPAKNMQLDFNGFLFQDLNSYFGIRMRHPSHLSQASSSSIFLISTDKFSPGERDWGEREAETSTWNINFKQSILAFNICVIHPVKKSKIWLRKNKLNQSPLVPSVRISPITHLMSWCNPCAWCRALPSLLTPGQCHGQAGVSVKMISFVSQCRCYCEKWLVWWR